MNLVFIQNDQHSVFKRKSTLISYAAEKKHARYKIQDNDENLKRISCTITL